MIRSVSPSPMRCRPRPAAGSAAQRRDWRVVLAWLGTIACLPAAAATLAVSAPLPDAVEACIAVGTCSIAQDSSFELGGIAAFRYWSPQGEGYLVRYPVLPPSMARDSQTLVDFDQEPPLRREIVSQEPLTGSLWLAVQARYASAAGDHDLQLYVDEVVPAMQRLLPRLSPGDATPDVLHFMVDDEALVSSQAYRRMVLDALVNVDEGTLRSAEPLLPCVADGCSVAQALALIGLRFVSEGGDLVLQFEPQDSRRALYSEETAYSHPDNGFAWRRDYFVQPVPLCGGGWLLLPALAVLAPFGRRARRRAGGEHP